MSEIFDKAIEIVFEEEGGYKDDPNDPGGETRYGIAKRYHPTEDILNLTKERAKEIYRHDYWEKIKGDSLPPKVSVMLLDTAVNVGVSRAIKFLQEVLGIHNDGIIGHKTLDSVFNMNVNEILVNYAGKRMSYYKSLPTFNLFGKGWLARTNRVLKYCQSMGS